MSSLRVLFGQRLRQLRREKYFTHQRLAKAAGMSVDFISLLERGKTSPSLVTLEKLANALECPIKDLFDFEGYSY
jgi:transcriptional regulator with XRE-family HTH domain